VNVLQLSAHSTLVPRDGGQIRSHHIGRCLKAAGFQVERLAVCWRTPADLDDPREPIVDVRLSPLWSSQEYQSTLAWWPHLDDYYFASAVWHAPRLREQLETRISACAPDVILLERPWTWPLIKDLPTVRSGATRVIYSSQNVETPLKRQTLGDAGISVPGQVLDGVEALERDLVRSSWATVACTQTDASIFHEWGASRIVVANNGAVARCRDSLLNTLPKPLTPQQRFVLFVGSGHLPNRSGFFNLIAPAVSRLRPNTRVVLAGGMCEAIDSQVDRSALKHYRHARLVSLGVVDDLTLDALIVNAAAILLPIEYGGGSNVKTAEALCSGRPMIATSASFRGFADYRELDQVTIADTPLEFEQAMQAALASPCRLPSGPVPRELTWEATLDPLIQMLGSKVPVS
jgi:hypothetical protein